MGEHSLHADVGPMQPVDYARNRHRPWPVAVASTAGGAVVAGNLPVGEA
jgi:hypothetical protein